MALDLLTDRQKTDHIGGMGAIANHHKAIVDQRIITVSQTSLSSSEVNVSFAFATGGAELRRELLR